MKTANNIFRKIEGSSDARLAIKTILAAEADFLDTPTLIKIFQSYPEHTDLIVGLSHSVQNEILEFVFKSLPTKVVESLLDAGSLSAPSPGLINAILSSRQARGILLSVLSKWLTEGVGIGEIEPLTDQEDLLAEAILNLPPLTSISRLEAYLKSTDSANIIVLAKLSEHYQNNPDEYPINLIPVIILKTFANSLDKAKGLLSKGATEAAAETIKAIMRDEEGHLTLDLAEMALLTFTKRDLKELIKSQNKEEIGMLLRLAGAAKHGEGFLTTKDLILFISDKNFSLKRIQKLATEKNILVLDIISDELIEAAIEEHNTLLLLEVLGDRVVSVNNKKLFAKISEHIAQYAKIVCQSDLFKNESHQELINTAISLNLRDGKVTDLYTYSYISKENIKAIVKNIVSLIDQAPDSKGLIAFCERNKSVLPQEEVEKIQLSALTSLGSAHGILKYSNDLELRKKAALKIRKSNKQSLEVLKDDEASLSDEEILTLISAMEVNKLSREALFKRVQNKEIESQNLSEPWQQFIEAMELDFALNISWDVEKVITLSNRLGIEALEDAFLKNKNAIEQICDGGLVPLEMILRRRGILFSLVHKHLGVKGLKSCFSDKEIVSHLRSARSLSVDSIVEAFNAGLIPDEIEAVEKAKIHIPEDIEKLCSILTDQQSTEALVRKVIQIYNRDLDDNGLGFPLLKHLVANHFNDFKRHSKTVKVINSKEICLKMIERCNANEMLEILNIFSINNQINVIVAVLDNHYSTEICKKALELSNDIKGKVFGELKWTTIKSILDDGNLGLNEKDAVLKDLSADTIEVMVQIYGPSLERRVLAKAIAWPTEIITKSQLSVLNNLSDSQGDLNIKDLFLDSIRTSEIKVSEELLNGIKDEELYEEVIGVIEDLLTTREYVNEALIETLLMSDLEIQSESFATYVAHYKKDWTRLNDIRQVEAIKYAISVYLADFKVEDKVLTFAERTLAYLKDGEIYFIASLNGLGAEEREILKTVVKLTSKLPDEVLGSYYVESGQFFPHDKTIPWDEAYLHIDVTDAALSSLKAISDKAVVRDIKAIRRGSIVYDLSVDQHDILEILSQGSEFLNEAKVIYDKVKKLKKNSLDLLEAMSQISESEDRKFGVELEVASSISREELAERIGSHVAAQNEYTSDMHWPQWTIKYDASVQGGEFEAELVSPILQGSEGIKELKSVMTKLNSVAKQRGVRLEVGEKTRTGLHVHHSVEDVIRKFGEIDEGTQVSAAMAEYLISVQGALYALCAKWRLANTYSRPIQNIQEISNEGSSRHGFAVTDYGTLEFRLKEATFNVGALVRWVVLTQQITISMIARLNNQLKESKQKLKEALEGGVDMIFDQQFDEAGNLKEDMLSHLAYYQAAKKFALSAA